MGSVRLGVRERSGRCCPAGDVCCFGKAARRISGSTVKDDAIAELFLMTTIRCWESGWQHSQANSSPKELSKTIEALDWKT